MAALLLGFKFVGVELYDKNISTAERILSGGQDEFDEDSLNSLLKDMENPDDSEDLLENTQAA